MPPRHSHRTRITPEVVADDVLLGEAIDKILLAEGTLQRAHRQVVRRQRAMRAAVTDEQWHRYLRTEEAFNDYHARAVSIVARAFFQAGTREKR